MCGVSCAMEWGRTRARHGGAREREGMQGGGEGGGGAKGGETRGVGCAQGTDVWVRVPASRQGFHERSALHWASEKGLAGTVAQLLALGADATLTDEVRAGICISMY